jgi:nucleotide-binding universal stress UspA family protein
MNIKTILHPHDFSEPSQQAFEFACNLAKDYQAKVIVLHVIDVPVAYPELVAALPDLDALRAEARRLLDQLQPPGAGVELQRLVVDGEPAFQILETARQHGADLIVMGTHGRTGIRRVIMGSIAEQVVRKATCPVIAVKVPGKQPEARAEQAAESAGVRAEA